MRGKKYVHEMVPLLMRTAPCVLRYSLLLSLTTVHESSAKLFLIAAG